MLQVVCRRDLHTICRGARTVTKNMSYKEKAEAKCFNIPVSYSKRAMKSLSKLSVIECSRFETELAKALARFLHDLAAIRSQDILNDRQKAVRAIVARRVQLISFDIWQVYVTIDGSGVRIEGICNSHSDRVLKTS